MEPNGKNEYLIIPAQPTDIKLFNSVQFIRSSQTFKYAPYFYSTHVPIKSKLYKPHINWTFGASVLYVRCAN